MNGKQEAWEIEVGNLAVVTETMTYVGTHLGAVRAAKKRWRERQQSETSLTLSRPGCRPIEVWPLC